jgi:hypothetical protein
LIESDGEQLLQRCLKILSTTDTPLAPFENQFEKYTETIESVIKILFDPQSISLSKRKPIMSEVGCNPSLTTVFGHIMNILDPFKKKATTVDMNEFEFPPVMANRSDESFKLGDWIWVSL